MREIEGKVFNLDQATEAGKAQSGRDLLGQAKTVLEKIKGDLAGKTGEGQEVWAADIDELTKAMQRLETLLQEDDEKGQSGQKRTREDDVLINSEKLLLRDLIEEFTAKYSGEQEKEKQSLAA